MQKEIDKYNDDAEFRLWEYSIQTQCPPDLGLTEPCSIWIGPKYNSGYGHMYYKGTATGVHRIALMIARRVDLLPSIDMLGEPLEVAHICNVKLCCEPSHVYLATREENAQDRVKNGLTRGEKNHTKKISEEIAREIKLSKGQESQKKRAKRFGVSPHIVQHIDDGTAWAWLPDVNGNNSDENRVKENKKRKIRRDVLKKKPWTKEIFENAIIIFDDPEYVEIQDTWSFNGTYCKIWIRTSMNGYPVMYVGDQQIMAHIMACTIGNNFKRIKDKEAAHECGHSLCVNPLHLKFKSSVENAADRIVNGTHARKISWEHVCEIRERFAKGEKPELLATTYNISYSYATKLIRNEHRING